MPNPNMTQEDYLKMFGTEEQLEDYYARDKQFKEWVQENVPVIKPKMPWEAKDEN